MRYWWRGQEPMGKKRVKCNLQMAKSHFLFIQPLSVHGWTSASLLDVHRLCDVIERMFSHSLPEGLAGWQSVISQGNIPQNTLSCPGIDPGPQGGQTVRHFNFPTELSWPGPWREQTARYIHSPTELSRPGPWRKQTVRFILSPLSYHDWSYGEGTQWDTFMVPLSYHDWLTLWYIKWPWTIAGLIGWANSAARSANCATVPAEDSG